MIIVSLFRAFRDFVAEISALRAEVLRRYPHTFYEW